MRAREYGANEHSEAIFEDVYLENRFEIAGKATPSPAPMMPLESSKGSNMRPMSAAVGVKTVNRDHSTTPAPSTTFEEYLVAT